MDKVELIHKTCRKVYKRLKKYKNSDISTQLDCIYFSYKILYKILYKFNVSYEISNQFEHMVKGGYGLISNDTLAKKIDTIIVLYEDLLKITSSVRERL